MNAFSKKDSHPFPDHCSKFPRCENNRARSGRHYALDALANVREALEEAMPQSEVQLPGVYVNSVVPVGGEP